MGKKVVLCNAGEWTMRIRLLRQLCTVARAGRQASGCDSAALVPRYIRSAIQHFPSGQLMHLEGIGPPFPARKGRRGEGVPLAPRWMKM